MELLVPNTSVCAQRRVSSLTILLTAKVVFAVVGFKLNFFKLHYLNVCQYEHFFLC